MMKTDTINSINNNHDAILDAWMGLEASAHALKNGYTMAHDDGKREQSDEILRAIVKSMGMPLQGSKPEAEHMHETMGAVSKFWINKGYSPRDTGNYVMNLKYALIGFLQGSISDVHLCYTESQAVGKIMDGLIMCTFESFIVTRQEMIRRQANEMEEISTPIIDVWDGIITIPVIGTLDSARAEKVMEGMLVKIGKSETRVAILDISGVPAVDSMVAQHIIKTVTAARLMGAECIVSGIRPDIAQTVVHLGIDLSGIITKSTLADALKTAFNIVDLRVTKR